MKALSTTINLNIKERKILTLASLGGMLEFYDFMIYGIFAVYFAHQFFPGGNPILAVIETYVVFVLGFIARPLGGIIFSYIGDEYGRKKVLLITVTIMGVSSLSFGLLPTYSQIGIAAPILLLCLRLIQGLALGGELPSTYVYISESLPDKKGKAFGITIAGVNAGLLLGIAINAVLNIFLTPSELSLFGWRIPFILGGGLCLISYFIRKTLHETAAFIKIREKIKFPLKHLLKYHWSQFFTATFIVAMIGGCGVVVNVYMPTYLHVVLKIENTLISKVMLIMMLVNLVVVYISGNLVDKISATKLLGFYLVIAMPLIPCAYWLISNGVSLITGVMLLGVLQGAVFPVAALLITDIFPAEIRLTGVALAYNMGNMLFGGMAPIIISLLIKRGYGVALSPAFYMLSLVLICLLGLYCMQKLAAPAKE